MKKRIAAAVAVLAVLCVVLLAQDQGSGFVPGGAVLDVLVTNLPQVQTVEGTVNVPGPIRQGVMHRFEEVVVTPVPRSNTLGFIEEGTLETDGFNYVVLSIQGEIKDVAFRPGTVGAILLPDEDEVMRVFREGGQIPFPLEVRVPVNNTGASFFFSETLVLPVGFPSYRVFFYNGTDRAAEVTLYVYLRN